MLIKDQLTAYTIKMAASISKNLNIANFILGFTFLIVMLIETYVAVKLTSNL